MKVVRRKLIRGDLESPQSRRGGCFDYTKPPKINRREAQAKQFAEKRGYEVLQSGWPDMLLWREADKKAVFLEVKPIYPNGTKDSLRASQKKMHTILKRLGLNVQIIYLK